MSGFDIISPRGLTIDGIGIGGSGIGYDRAASLTVTNCTVRHFPTVGIWIKPRSDTKFFISNTLLLDNGSAGLGVSSQDTATGNINGTIDHVAASESKASSASAQPLGGQFWTPSRTGNAVPIGPPRYGLSKGSALVHFKGAACGCGSPRKGGCPQKCC